MRVMERKQNLAVGSWRPSNARLEGVDLTAVGSVGGMQLESPGGRLLARPGFWGGGRAA